MEKSRISPFLSFTGKAEEAMQFYADNLPGASIQTLVRYENNHPNAAEGEENNILFGEISLMSQTIKCLDMPAAYPAPDFNWANSIFIDCCDEAEFDTIFNALSKDGSVMMGPMAVAHLRKCAWVVDKFGVTWQPVWE